MMSGSLWFSNAVILVPFIWNNVSIMKNTPVIVPVGLYSEYQTPF